MCVKRGLLLVEVSQDRVLIPVPGVGIPKAKGPKWSGHPSAALGCASERVPEEGMPRTSGRRHPEALVSPEENREEVEGPGGRERPGLSTWIHRGFEL